MDRGEIAERPPVAREERPKTERQGGSEVYSDNVESESDTRRRRFDEFASIEFPVPSRQPEGEDDRGRKDDGRKRQPENIFRIASRFYRLRQNEAHRVI